MMKVYVTFVEAQNINVMVLIGREEKLLDQLIEKHRGKADYDVLSLFPVVKTVPFNCII